MKQLVIAFFVLTLCSCVDEVDLAPIKSGSVLQDILVVEGTITNEVKNHRIRISKIDTILDLRVDSIYNPFTPPRDIEVDLINYEENAVVTVADDNGATFNFNEISPGIYQSSQAFGAEIDKKYQLSITRANGREYSSEAMHIQGVSEVSDIYAEKIVNDEGLDGIGIFINNNDLDGNSQNLRFNYTETYKVIAPNWTPLEFKLTNYDPCALPVPTYDLEIIERSQEEQTCYATQESNTIIQAQLSDVEGSGFSNYMVRFLDRNNFAISHRYSIEIEQLVTGIESYSFYEQLNSFSQSESVFSQVQPGFLEGNLTSDDGVSGTIIGFFDVVSVSKKRLFFNYTDFYPNEPLPPYPFNCGLHSSPESHVSYCFTGEVMNPCPQSIIERVNLNVISYVAINDAQIGTCPGPYIYVADICGDCTKLGSNIVPEFWEE